MVDTVAIIIANHRFLACHAAREPDMLPDLLASNSYIDCVRWVCVTIVREMTKQLFLTAIPHGLPNGLHHEFLFQNTLGREGRAQPWISHQLLDVILRPAVVHHPLRLYF